MPIDTLIDKEFCLDQNLTYLNHAAVAPWPRRTARAVADFAEENFKHGALRYPMWVKTEALLREQIQGLINANSPDEIALLKNTSEALSVVAYGLDWKPGDNVVICNLEFPSNRIVWESLISRGVEVREAEIRLDDQIEAEESLIEQCDERTRLLSVSAIQYACGLRMDLEKLGRYCRNHGIYFCVDAIQAVGAVEFDVQAQWVDFAMADAHKWMLGPEGIAFFYCREQHRERLRLHQYGWHMVENCGDYTARRWDVAQSARRFECGSPNMLGIHALSASVSLLLEAGMNKIQSVLLEKIRLMIEQINEAPNLTLLSPQQHNRYGGIVTFSHNRLDTGSLFNILIDKQIVCASRGGGIRFSPHFYTPMEKIQQAIELAASA